MQTLLLNQLPWAPGRQAGVERAILSEHASGGRTAAFRLQPGAGIEAHGHLGREELIVISGRLRVGGTELGPGDYHAIAAGEQHALEAIEPCLFYVMTEKVLPGR